MRIQSLFYYSSNEIICSQFFFSGSIRQGTTLQHAAFANMSKSRGSIAPLPPPLVSSLVIQLAILHLKFSVCTARLYVQFTRNFIHNSQEHSLHCINVKTNQQGRIFVCALSNFKQSTFQLQSKYSLFQKCVLILIHNILLM